MQKNTKSTTKESADGKSILESRHAKMFVLIACLMLVCIAGWRIAWSELHMDEAIDPAGVQTTSEEKQDAAASPAKKTPPSGSYVAVSDDFSNLQITDARTPVYDIYTLNAAKRVFPQRCPTSFPTRCRTSPI